MIKKLVIISGMCLWGSLSFGEWWITTVDDGLMGGVSIVLDSLDDPHIAYNAGLKGPSKYASWNPDSTWTIEEITSGSNPQLKFDSKWCPHIAHIYGYVYKDSTGWHSDDGVWGGYYEISIDLDSEDYPHVLGSLGSLGFPDGVLHSYKDSLGWHSDTVESEGTSISTEYGSAIIVDNDDSIHITYPSPSGLVYAKKIERGWYKEIVDNAGIHLSMVLDTFQRLCIAYRYNGILRYARKDTTGWEITVVDSEDTPITYPSLAIDKNNFPRICYISEKIPYTQLDLKYAWFDGDSWNFTIVDNNMCEMITTSTGIVVDDENISHISYQHQIEKVTKYARGHGFVGIEEREKLQVTGHKLQVCPNPFIKFAEVRSEKREARIKVYDMMGQLVEERFFADVQNDRLEIGKDLSSGVYFVKVKGYKPTKIIKMRGVK